MCTNAWAYSTGVRVMSNRTCLVDTCCHFRGRNKGPRALETEETLRKNRSLHHLLPKRGQGGRGRMKKNRPASAMASLSSSRQTAGRAENRSKKTENQHKPKLQTLSTVVRPSSPNVDTRRIRSPKKQARRRQPSQLTEDHGVTNEQYMSSLESPGTELRNMRENLRLSISKFRENIDEHVTRRRKKSSPPKRSPMHYGSRTGDTSSAGAKYDATDPDRIDPDQLLEELNGHATMVQYKAWSPKASQANEFF